MEISAVSSASSSASSSSATIPDCETQIEQLEAMKRNHQKLISSERQSGDKANSELKIEQLEAQIQLMEVQIQQLRTHEMMQNLQKEKSQNSKKEKDESAVDSLTSLKNEFFNNKLDVTI